MTAGALFFHSCSDSPCRCFEALQAQWRVAWTPAPAEDDSPEEEHA